MDNLMIYNQIKDVPKEAQKPIKGGRLNGMTDIKPMWRIEKLTEVFGPVGLGWYTKTLDKKIMEGANSEQIAIVDIELFVNYKKPYGLEDDLWSVGIEGSGGSSFVAKEKNGMYTSDECFKMAYTDALSVACKALGMGANVYWGDSKYTTSEPTKEDAESYEFKSGKHEGWTLKRVVEEDKNFLKWLLNNSKDEYLLKCIELLTGEIPMSEEEQDARLELTQKLMRLIVDKGVDLDKMLEHYSVSSVNDLNNEQLNKLIANFEKR
jgi:hypothetical protein